MLRIALSALGLAGVLAIAQPASTEKFTASLDNRSQAAMYDGREAGATMSAPGELSLPTTVPAGAGLSSHSSPVGFGWG